MAQIYAPGDASRNYQYHQSQAQRSNHLIADPALVARQAMSGDQLRAMGMGTDRPIRTSAASVGLVRGSPGRGANSNRTWHWLDGNGAGAGNGATRARGPGAAGGGYGGGSGGGYGAPPSLDPQPIISRSLQQFMPQTGLPPLPAAGQMAGLPMQGKMGQVGPAMGSYRQAPRAMARGTAGGGPQKYAMPNRDYSMFQGTR